MAPSLFSSLSVCALFFASAVLATSCPTDPMCGIKASISDQAEIISENSGCYAQTTEYCAELCSEITECGGFFIIEMIQCQLFAGTAAASSIVDSSTSIWTVYDISCFSSSSLTISSTISSSSASSSLAYSTTTSVTISTSSLISSVQPSSSIKATASSTTLIASSSSLIQTLTTSSLTTSSLTTSSLTTSSLTTSSLTTSSLTTSSAVATSSCLADPICGTLSFALTDSTYIVNGGLASTVSVQACADFCLTVSGCGFFAFGALGQEVYQLFSGSAAASTTANPASEFWVYDISCFFSSCSASSSSTQPPTTTSLSIITSSSLLIQTTSSPAAASSAASSCVSVAPTCSANAISDPSFELNDGSWSFWESQIIAGTTLYPARTGFYLAQLTFSGLAGDEISASFAQQLDTPCIDSLYNFISYYSVPTNPGGISCTLEVDIDGSAVYYSTSIDLETSGSYQEFTGSYTSTSSNATVIISADCTYGPTGTGVFELDFDDLILELVDPLAVSSCSSVPVPTPSSIISSSAAATSLSVATTTLSSSVSTIPASSSQSMSLFTAPLNSSSSIFSASTFYSSTNSSSSVPMSSLASFTFSNSSSRSVPTLAPSSATPYATRNSSSTSKRRRPCSSVFGSSPSKKRFPSSTSSTNVITPTLSSSGSSILTQSPISSSASINPVSQTPALFTTSTIYSTITYTVSKCAPTVTNCPYGHTTTQVAAISTTICPVSATQAVASSIGTEGYTPSTVYATTIYKITSYKPTVTNCPVGSVTTETVSLYTTYCPVTESETSAVVGGSVSAIYPVASTVLVSTLLVVSVKETRMPATSLGLSSQSVATLISSPTSSLPVSASVKSLSLSSTATAISTSVLMSSSLTTNEQSVSATIETLVSSYTVRPVSKPTASSSAAGFTSSSSSIHLSLTTIQASTVTASSALSPILFTGAGNRTGVRLGGLGLVLGVVIGFLVL